MFLKKHNLIMNLLLYKCNYIRYVLVEKYFFIQNYQFVNLCNAHNPASIVIYFEIN